MEIAHLGVVVRDLDQALRVWCTGLGGTLVWRRRYEREAAEIALVEVAGLPVELLMPVGEGALLRHLEKRGEGMHHLAFRAKDPAAVEGALKAVGVEVVESSRQEGAEGRGAVFFHPKTTGGVLLEVTG
ncbi:VOC family protein [bacterium]|nr:VOC family protein [bacterium]